MHLTEDQLVAVLCGDAKDADVQHARLCTECGSTVERFRQQLDEARDEYVKAAERDDNFWLRQKAAIRERKRLAGRPIMMPRSTMAAVALIVLAAGLILSSPQAPQVAQNQQSDPDYQLLVDVEQNLARPVPVAIEPARVLSADLNAAWQNAFPEKSSQQSAAQR